MTAEEKTERFGEELEMVWILDDENIPRIKLDHNVISYAWAVGEVPAELS